jgi:hypothetical protein
VDGYNVFYIDAVEFTAVCDIKLIHWVIIIIGVRYGSDGQYGTTPTRLARWTSADFPRNGKGMFLCLLVGHWCQLFGISEYVKVWVTAVSTHIPMISCHRHPEVHGMRRISGSAHQGLSPSMSVNICPVWDSHPHHLAQARALTIGGIHSRLRQPDKSKNIKSIPPFHGAERSPEVNMNTKG